MTAQANGAGEPPRGRAVLLRWGSNSGANDSVAAALRRVRPGLELDEIDLSRLLRRDLRARLGALVGTIGEYGAASLRSRDALRYRLLRSVAFGEIGRRLVRERTAGRRYDFSLQMQSLFNGATGRWPHFVYTDHAALAREHAGGWTDAAPRPSDAWLAAEAAIYRDADHVFTFGSSVARVIVDRYGAPADRVSCIGAGANVTPAAPPSTALERYARRRVLFVGVEWERKGGPELVEAFSALRRRLPDATLTIVGCAPAVSAEGCEVLGRLPMAEVGRRMAEASCLCVPSRFEPFGLVFLEAYAFALPVVSTTVGDIGDMVVDGENGLRVPPADPARLAEALAAVLGDPGRCRAMGLASLARAPGATWERVAERILAQAPPAGPAEAAA